MQPVPTAVVLSLQSHTASDDAKLELQVVFATCELAVEAGLAPKLSNMAVRLMVSCCAKKFRGGQGLSDSLSSTPLSQRHTLFSQQTGHSKGVTNPAAVPPQHHVPGNTGCICAAFA